MKALLRHLKGDMRVAIRLPCNNEILKAKGVWGSHLVAFSGRCGVTEGVKHSKEQLKTMSRHQQLVSFSSMGSESDFPED